MLAVSPPNASGGLVPASHWMPEGVAALLREEIETADGREVFFIGRIGADGKIFEVEAHAFGTADAVPALGRRARPGEVVLHNHPSGPLDPSGADVEIAAALGTLDIGFFIIDNAALQVRVVVRPAPPRHIEPLDPDAIAAALGPARPGGPATLGAGIEGYEARPQQQDMGRLVADAFNRGGIAVIEAGTGTGKSFAYLLPALRWAIANGERVVVSTNTINLQEQLIHKDLPALVRALEPDARFELLKGRGNYVCRRKAQIAGESWQLELLETEERAELRTLLDWIKVTEDGSLGDLPVRPSPEVWDRVASDHDNCLRVQCPFYEKCFFYGARRRAARAQVLVVNHALLMADLSLRQESGNYHTTAILPPYQHLIIDEAHNLEEAATRYFSAQTTREGLRRVLRRIYNGRGNQGLALQLAQAAEANRGASADGEATTALLDSYRAQIPMRVDEALDRVDAGFGETIHALLDHLGIDGTLKRGEPAHLRVTPAVRNARLWSEFLAGDLGLLESVREALVAVVNALRESEEHLAETKLRARPEVTGPSMELRAQRYRLERLLRRLRIFAADSADVCRWMELRETARGRRLSLEAAPLDMRPLLRESLFERLRTVVLTSATITVGGRFDYMTDRLGLGGEAEFAKAGAEGELAYEPDVAETPKPRLPEPLAPGFELAPPPGVILPPTLEELADIRGRLRLLRLETPFDFDRQSIVSGIEGMPDPRDGGFAASAAAAIVPPCIATRGRALLLFTSYAMLDRTYRAAQAELIAAGLMPMRQTGQNRHRLLEEFRHAEAPVLFATSSFWEGIDLRGDDLLLLALVQLPFSVPTDPLHQARIEWLQTLGRNAFTELSLPQAVIRFRQGFGRLIRSKTDRGIVVIVDPRIHTKPYGRVFQRSLPVRRVRRETPEQLAASVTELLAATRGA